MGDRKSLPCERCHKMRRNPVKGSKFCAPCRNAIRASAKGAVDHAGHLTVEQMLDLAGKVEEVAVTEQSARDWTAGVPDLTGDALVISDMHVPEHDPQTLKRLAQVGLARGIKLLIVNGDLMTLDGLGSYPQIERRGGMHPVESIARAARVLGALLQVFDRIVVTGGNHDVGRLTKLIDRAVNGRTRDASILADLEADEADCQDFETRYTTVMERHAERALGELWKRIAFRPETCSYLTSGGRRFLITHQKASARRQPYEGLNIWQREQCSVITGHTHIAGIVRAPNGTDLLINPGCATKRAHARYAVRHDTGWPEWSLGFCAIVNGVVTLYGDGLTDWASVESAYAAASRPA